MAKDVKVRRNYKLDESELAALQRVEVEIPFPSDYVVTKATLIEFLIVSLKQQIEVRQALLSDLLKRKSLNPH